MNVSATSHADARIRTARARPRILVVDDDPLSRSLQARLVGLLGYHARSIAQPLDALDAAFDPDVDAMLLDLGMPELDGITLLGRLREREARSGRAPLPVIAVTGYAASVDRLRCLMAGFNDHLTKPLEARALAQALRRHLPADAPAAAPQSDALRVEAAARRLAQVKPDDARFAPTMLETFAMRSGQLIEDIVRAHAQRDGAVLTQALKALRASAEFMGATSLAALCVRLRDATAAGEFESAATQVRDLADEHQSILAVLLLSDRDGTPPG